MRSPSGSDLRRPGPARLDGQMHIDHGIERVVHLPLDPAQRTDLYQGAELSPASQGNADWLETLYPAHGIDAFLATELVLPIDTRLLLAPVFNGLLDSAIEDLESLGASDHPAAQQIAAALEVLQSQADLRELLLRYRNALLEA